MNHLPSREHLESYTVSLSSGYAILNAMLFYVSKVPQETRRPALKKFLSSKGCTKFMKASELLREPLTGIIGAGTIEKNA